MDWTAILAAAKVAFADLTGPAAQQAAQLVSGFTAALPAIKAGIASAEPFVVSGFNLLANREQGVPSDQWATQLALMQVQLDAVDAQVAADETAQP